MSQFIFKPVVGGAAGFSAGSSFRPFNIMGAPDYSPPPPETSYTLGQELPKTQAEVNSLINQEADKVLQQGAAVLRAAGVTYDKYKSFSKAQLSEFISWIALNPIPNVISAYRSGDLAKRATAELLADEANMYKWLLYITDIWGAKGLHKQLIETNPEKAAQIDALIDKVNTLNLRYTYLLGDIRNRPGAIFYNAAESIRKPLWDAMNALYKGTINLLNWIKKAAETYEDITDPDKGGDSILVLVGIAAAAAVALGIVL